MPDKQSSWTIVGLGEILWDIFPEGPRFGGAPANFACTAAGLLGPLGRVVMAGGVGVDELGQAARSALQQHGVDTSCLCESHHPTGKVLVTLDAHGHASYEFAPNSAWDYVTWTPAWAQLAEQTDVVCFGTLGQRSAVSRQTIRQFVAAVPTSALRILDINLRPPFWDAETLTASLPLSNFVKLNDVELPIVAEVLQLRGHEPQQLLQQLLDRYSLQGIALTRGGHGALLGTAAGEWSDTPGAATAVVDTVGAGDAYTAALAIGWSGGDTLPEINAWANQVAAYVCAQPGATPPLPAHLRR